MIRSCVTVSLVPEARGGQFIFWDDLSEACRKAGQLNFDAVELFATPSDLPEPETLVRLLDDHGLKLAALGTGSGWVRHRLTLTDGDRHRRERARQFVCSLIEYGGPFRAPVIVGSMQGRWTDCVDRDTALSYLCEALDELAEHAERYGVPLIFEPLNRYESNLVNTVADGLSLLERLSSQNVRLLADLFHMNIEEADLGAALRAGGSRIGHLHFADSNRRPVGCGHLDFVPIVSALREIGYDGYASAEALPYPDSEAAARTTRQAFRRLFEVSDGARRGEGLNEVS
ncbi:MAG: sugar phosphate isomerase/epimerase [Planctomycetes bacterium]|nr:sugar phosphate isomerase/epimerase [Planctomycetota bacterium]